MLIPNGILTLTSVNGLRVSDYEDMQNQNGILTFPNFIGLLCSGMEKSYI